MNFVDKQMIINFFTDNACVESGYVLDFNRLSFSQFSIRALGKNILMDDLSVGKSLKKFINGASSHDILKFTYYLMEHFNKVFIDRDNYLDSSPNTKSQYEYIQRLLDNSINSKSDVERIKQMLKYGQLLRKKIHETHTNSDSLFDLMEQVFELYSSDIPKLGDPYNQLQENSNLCVRSAKTMAALLFDYCQKRSSMINLWEDDQPDDVAFVDIERRYIDELLQAKYVIWISMAWFTSEKIYDLVLQKQRDGVAVELILDDNEQNHKLNFNQDFQVHWVNMSSNFKNIMHTKFCIIDLSKVMEGSYNLTNAANYNKETLNIFTGKNMVSMYADEFVTLKKKASS